MPIYEYACKKCGEFEITQRITEDPLRKCPICRRRVTKLISQSAFHLKGGGWYATDYSKNGAAKSDSGNETKTGSDKKDNAGSTSTSNSSSKSAST